MSKTDALGVIVHTLLHELPGMEVQVGLLGEFYTFMLLSPALNFEYDVPQHKIEHAKYPQAIADEILRAWRERAVESQDS